MSLLVLKTTPGELAFNFQNNFREAITLTPNTQVQLVNMIVNKDSNYTIVQGQNDRFTYRLGSQNNRQFFNKVVIVPAGTYRAGELAEVMKQAINNRNQLKNYTFDMQYDSDKNVFKLSWSQTSIPSAGGADYTTMPLGGLDDTTITESANHTTITPATIAASNNNLFTRMVVSEKGIFPDGGQISCVIEPLDAGGYGRVALGLSRVGMAFPAQFGNDPTDPNVQAHIASTSNIVADYVLELFDNANPATQTQLRVRQLTQQPGTIFPNPGWFNMNTRRGPQNITTALPTLNSGTDHIRLTITLSQIRTLTFSIAHDTAGDGTFINNTQFAQTGGGGFNSTIREEFFPLTPVLAFSNGAAANPPKDLTLFGNYVDDNDGNDLNATHLSATQIAEINAATIENHPTQQGSVLEKHSLPFVKPGVNKNHGGDDTLNLGLGVGTMQPVQYFQFGPSSADDYVAGGGTIPNNQDPANATGGSAADRLIPNINTTLGLTNIVYAAANSGVNGEVESTEEPEEDITAPGLLVELPDFNIKGINGETGDTLPSIAVFHKEDPDDGSRDGSLTYTAKYPLPLDLNLPNTQNVNLLRVRIRSDDGTLADFLKPATSITLYLTEKRETTADMVVERMEEMLKRQGEMQQNQIAQINSKTQVV